MTISRSLIDSLLRMKTYVYAEKSNQIRRSIHTAKWEVQNEDTLLHMQKAHSTMESSKQCLGYSAGVRNKSENCSQFHSRALVL